MTVIEKLFSVAKAEEGYLEKSLSAYQRKHAIVYEKELGAGKDNITKYWEDIDVGMQGDLWCQVFVYWCFVKAFGTDLARRMLYLDSDQWKVTDKWRDFYTPNWSENFKLNKASVQSSKVQPGYIVYFKNSKRVHHTGIVLDVKRYSDGTGLLTTIEGNTSSGSDVVSNGGCVRIKQYPMTKSGISSVANYGVPNFSLYKEETDDERPVIKEGYHDEDYNSKWCAVLQDALNKLGYRDEDGNKLKVDGHCGDHTVAAIENFQRANGLTVDGHCGPKTWAAIDHALSVLTVTLNRIDIPAGKYEYDRVQDGYYHLVKYDIWVKA